MKTKTICIILQSDFPPDVRLSREASALIASGYRIHVLCNNKSRHEEYEFYQGVHIHRAARLRRLPDTLHKLINLPVFTNPIWAYRLWRLHRRQKLHFLHVVNLPLALLGIMFAKIFGIRVVYDLYETYPEAIRSWKLTGISALTHHPRFADLLDRLCVRLSDALIVVTAEAKQRLVKLAVPPQKIIIVENTIDLDGFFSHTIEPEILEKFKNDYVITYVGQFSPERGLETAIVAMPEIVKHIPNAKLLLVGGGPSYDSLKAYAKKLNCGESVEFTGWVDYKLFPSYIQASDVCIIPHPSNSFIDTTMPNKMFEYMAMGKPIVVSDSKPLMRIVNECRTGVVFESLSPQSFARAIVQVQRSSVNFEENGKKAVEGKYNWQVTAAALINLYEQLTTERRPCESCSHRPWLLGT